MDLSLKQTLRQTLAPQMELSTRILQMDSMQLADYLGELVLENPVAEIDLPRPDADLNSPRELALRKLEWLENQTHRERENTGYYEDDDSPTPEISEGEGEALTDHLIAQLSDGCAPDLRHTVEYIIGCLDENGYLYVSEAEICEDLGCSSELLRRAIARVQELEPAGVGARSISECLSLQLGEDDVIARRLVMEHIDAVAKNQVDALAKAIGVAREEITAAMVRIRALHAKPGSIYGRFERPAFITPDVVVTNFQDQYNVMLCEFSYPRLHVSESYLQMARETKDQAVADYIGDKLNQILWVQKCIESRNSTLLAVAKSIVKRQEKFFRHGTRFLNVLRMKDVAEMIEMHESTVSRAVRDKYLQCAHGVFPLRHFFVQGVEGDQGMVSSHDAQQRIRELIAEENPKKPLSDQKLCELLVTDGIAISRRTVAKYRDALGIPGSSSRGC